MSAAIFGALTGAPGLLATLLLAAALLAIELLRAWGTPAARLWRRRLTIAALPLACLAALVFVLRMLEIAGALR